MKQKFKKGDKVITKGYSKDYDGKILTINRIVRDCAYFDEAEEPNHNFGLESISEIITAEETKHPYKIGDKVLVNWPESTRYNGKVLTIKRIDDDKYCYFEEAVIDTHNFNINRIVKIIKPEETQHGYEVGDKVIVKGYSQRWDGKILTISNIYESGGEEFCNFKESDRPDLNFHIGNIVRKVKPEEMKHKYKVGDKVLLKTKAQFEEEFGPEWRTTVHQGWIDGMDEWFGKEITISRTGKNSVSLHYNAEKSMYFFGEEMIVGKAKESTEPVFSVGQQVRFKTEEEFLKEFGPKWTREIKYGWNRDGKMDYLFGKHFIIESIEDKCVKGHREGWNVSTDMITPDISIPSSSSYYYYKVGDKITLMGIEYTLESYKNYYYWNASMCNNGKIFNILDLNKESFIKSIVGYYMVGDFPLMKSLGDVEKITNALITKCFEHYSSQPDLELGDEVIFTVGGKDYKYTVKEDDCGFYCESYNFYNDEIFHVLGITEKEASSKALGYYEGGRFPYTYTLEDLTILVNYIREKCTEHNYKLRDITIRNFVPEGSGILEQIERSHLVPFEVNNAYEELLSDMIIVQLGTYSHPIELWQHDADKVNIFKLETSEDSIEKPEVKHIINIFDYEV